jgi:hypothetical protein
VRESDLVMLILSGSKALSDWDTIYLGTVEFFTGVQWLEYG